MGVWKNHNAEENVDGRDLAHEVSEENKESIGDLAKSNSYYILVNNLASCYSYPGNLSEAE